MAWIHPALEDALEHGGERLERLPRIVASCASMGTVFSIVTYGEDEKVLRNSVREAFAEIQRLNSRLSYFQPESELSFVNRCAWPNGVLVSREFAEIVAASLRYSEQTAGAFDITAGPLMKAWGIFRRQVSVPSDEELAHVLSRTGFRSLYLSSYTGTVKFLRERMELDLGAIGKGYAVDRGIEILRRNGVTRALLSSGRSSIFALGAPPGKAGWQISLCDPVDSGKRAALLMLRDVAISVSGSSERYSEVAGRRLSHIIDPRNGQPVARSIMAAVVAPDAMQTDAISTALCISGMKGARAYLEKHPRVRALLFDPDGSSQDAEPAMLMPRGAAEWDWGGRLLTFASTADRLP